MARSSEGRAWRRCPYVGRVVRRSRRGAGSGVGRRQQLGTAIVEARHRKEREAERLRQFQSLLARAKEALDKNEPAVALRAASDALQADPASTIAKDLHDRAEVALREYLDRRRIRRSTRRGSVSLRRP